MYLNYKMVDQKDENKNCPPISYIQFVLIVLVVLLFIVYGYWDYDVIDAWLNADN